MTEKTPSQTPPVPVKTTKSSMPPTSFIVWLLILVGIGALLMFNYKGEGKIVVFTQTEFLTALRAQKIQEVTISPEPETTQMYTIVGKLKIQTDKPVVLADKATDSAQKNHPKPQQFTCDLVITDSLWAEIDQNIKKVDVQTPSQWIKIIVSIFLPLLLVFFLIYFFIIRNIKNANSQAMGFGKSRAKEVNPKDNNTKFADVAGIDEAKDEIMEIVEYLKNPIKFQMVGAKIPKGALLVGPPGTGKTLMAKAVAGEAGVPFFAISGSDFMEMFVGLGASRVRDMFVNAREKAPCLIFIDEIDAIGRTRFTGIGGGHDEREQTLNALLVEMDGLQKNEGVIILAATNRADVLDKALLRPGRFDRQISIPLPDIKGRQQILSVHIKNIRVEKDLDVERIARSTTGFSGAELANLVNEAALLAARNERDFAIQADFEESRDKVLWGRERKSMQLTEKHRKMTAYHESGHTIIALFTPDAVPVHKVTIVPRGQALGATFMLPKEDRYSLSKREMLASIKVAMGGRIADEIFSNDLTSGASCDIAQASDIARTMVTQYAMTDKLGFLRFGERGDHIFMGRDIARNEACSEETAREIDLEIREIVNSCYKEAKALVLEHRHDVETLCQALLKDETLDINEIQKLLNIKEEANQEI